MCVPEDTTTKRPASGEPGAGGYPRAYRNATLHHVKKTKSLSPHSHEHSPPLFGTNSRRVWSWQAQASQRTGKSKTDTQRGGAAQCTARVNLPRRTALDMPLRGSIVAQASKTSSLDVYLALQRNRILWLMGGPRTRKLLRHNLAILGIADESDKASVEQLTYTEYFDTDKMSKVKIMGMYGDENRQLL